MYFHLRKTILIFLIVVLPFSGCGFRTSHPVKIRMSTAVLQEATLEQLEEIINSNATRLNTLKANVDIDSSVLEQKKDKVTDNPQFAGILLVRKPDMLRIRMLVPLVRNTAADMVSNGTSFSLAIPPKSRFIVGSNRQPAKPSPDPIYNMRPQHISDALLLKPIDPEREIAVLENTTEIVKDPKTHKDVEQGAYMLIIIGKDNGGSFLSRKIVFSRTDLLPHEQFIYDRQARLVTYAHYENFSDNSGISFPNIVSVQRPIEGYSLTISMVKVDVNVPLTDEQFVLTQPAGSQLINLDTQSSASALRDEENKKPH